MSQNIPNNYGYNVFINCPCDPTYRPILNSIIFTIHYLGFIPRCALEVENAAMYRLEIILEIIKKCQYGIHDISRTECAPFPRFNMPFELGLFLGCNRFGASYYSNQCCLILDLERRRYHETMSDISGQDIQSHEDIPNMAIDKVRNWLRSNSQQHMPGGNFIYNEYKKLNRALPSIPLFCHSPGIINIGVRK